MTYFFLRLDDFECPPSDELFILPRGEDEIDLKVQFISSSCNLSLSLSLK